MASPHISWTNRLSRNGCLSLLLSPIKLLNEFRGSPEAVLQKSHPFPCRHVKRKVQVVLTRMSGGSDCRVFCGHIHLLSRECGAHRPGHKDEVGALKASRDFVYRRAMLAVVVHVKSKSSATCIEAGSL